MSLVGPMLAVSVPKSLYMPYIHRAFFSGVLHPSDFYSLLASSSAGFPEI